MSSSDRDVRIAVYRHTMDSGVPPTVAAVAEQLALTLEQRPFDVAALAIRSNAHRSAT